MFKLVGTSSSPGPHYGQFKAIRVLLFFLSTELRREVPVQQSNIIILSVNIKAERPLAALDGDVKPGHKNRKIERAPLKTGTPQTLHHQSVVHRETTVWNSGRERASLRS